MTDALTNLEREIAATFAAEERRAGAAQFSRV